MSTIGSRTVVPPYLLERLASAERFPAASRAAQRTLRAQEPGRKTAILATGQRPARAEPVEETQELSRRVYDAEGTETLPGSLVRQEGGEPSADPAVNEAYDGLGRTAVLFREVYGRASIDGQGMPLLASVHYGLDYDNAFWNGEQMVFGDGDGEVFRRFTVSLSVIGHEMTHGVTERTAALRYHGQSGALNESVSDVFGCLVEQYAHGHSAAEASWLIGEGLFTPEVQGTALRSLKAPGTAYDDDVLGSDPQPATMIGYVETSDDEGGVHINSGIPNHAFYLAATRLGGNAWETAGTVWYQTITGGELTADASFADFARATIATAERGTDPTVATAISDAWAEVGVLSGDTGSRAEASEQPASPPTVAVTRSGGVAGLTRTWSIDVEATSDTAYVIRLLATLPWDGERREATGGADRFSYRFRCSPLPGTTRDAATTLAEDELTEPWRELYHLVREAAENDGGH